MSMVRTLCWVLPILFMVACSTLPEEPASTESYSESATLSGTLADLEHGIQPALLPKESAFQLLPKASEALAWRLALIDSAERSIDAQYFVWHDDAAGSLLMERLFAAADRGVKVRLLVDDLHLVSATNISGNDLELACVDYHPNVELKLFNPGKYRDGLVGSLGSMASDSLHYNRRMHNKLLLVDGHFAIVGGRNVGNEYFGLDETFNFVDVDVLVVGSVIPQIASGFDLYWNSDLPYTAGALAEVNEEQYRTMRRLNAEYVKEQADVLWLFEETDHSARFAGLGERLHRGTASFYFDDPVAREKVETRLYDLVAEISVPEDRTTKLLSATPYLIPSPKMLDLIGQDVNGGLSVKLLTNSLATNNQPAVHSHYKKYRDVLLDVGVELFELHHQPRGSLRDYVDTPPVKSGYIGLHMKASVYNDGRCFVGTMNLDPRSIKINTEDVLYIESQGLCDELWNYLSGIFTPDATWSVQRDDAGDLQWTSFEGTVERQPARKASQRLMDSIYRLMPEGQL